jgi:hypothetical protein
MILGVKVPRGLKNDSHANFGKRLTTAENGRDAIKAAQMILPSVQKNPKPRDQKAGPIVEECLGAVQELRFPEEMPDCPKGALKSRGQEKRGGSWIK